MKKLLTKIRDGLKQAWNWADGKKTYIGLALHAGWCLANLIDRDLTDGPVYWEIHGYIGALTGIGAGDKVRKAINKAKGK